MAARIKAVLRPFCAVHCCERANSISQKLPFFQISIMQQATQKRSVGDRQI
jgi:hypothetical protein